MKKIISIVLALICLTAVLTGCSLDTYTDALKTEGEEVKFSVDNEKAVVIEVENKSTVKEIIIPDEFGGVPVKAINDFAIVNLEYATKITIGKNVEEIGLWAIQNNQHLNEITVDEENEYFKSVDGVLYTKDMKTLLAYPPAKCGEYAIPEGIETIRTKAFYKCSNLTSITIPDSVKSIGEKAFFRCGLKELVLPEKIEAIGKDAFSYCSEIPSLVIPASIKEIGDYAFYNCTSMLDLKVGAKEADITLGEKWYPTNNGLNINELKIEWAE